MTLPVPTIQLFENDEVQMIEKDGQWFITVRSIAKILNSDYRSLLRIIQRHQELFIGLKGSDIMSTPGGSQEVITLNRDGVLTLLSSVDYKRLPKDRADKVIRFRRWMIETVGKVIDRKIEAPKLNSENPIVRYLETGHALHTLYGVPLNLSGLISLNMAEEATGLNLEPYKRILPPEQDADTPYLNAGQIGARVGLSASAVNQLLKFKGLIIKPERDWRLTKKGMEYGAAFPFTRNGHSGYHIRWREQVLELFPNGKQLMLPVVES